MNTVPAGYRWYTLRQADKWPQLCLRRELVADSYDIHPYGEHMPIVERVPAKYRLHVIIDGEEYPTPDPREYPDESFHLGGGVLSLLTSKQPPGSEPGNVANDYPP